MAKKISKAVQERRRKKSTESPLTSRNRFEIHQNRSKYNILGRKEKHDRGAPGISRSKANEKRKKTLLQKYMQRNKSNVLVDKRFGEFDDSVSVEEKMLKRFTLEKQSHHVKAGHYNITDADEEEQLTHYGQSLADISNFDEIDLESDDESEDNDDMSGGLLRKKKTRNGKSSQDEEDDDEEGRKLTKKEILQEMIVDSKRDKNERRKTKELAFELTQRLDKEWKDIHLLLTKSTSKTEPKEKQDDYDKIVKELVFEAKGKPTERLKSAEEIAKKEERRRAKLEKERLSRMELEEEPDEQEDKHLSADALIKKTEKKVDDRYILQYKDGEMVMPEGFQEGLIPDLEAPQCGEDGEKEEEEGEGVGEANEEDEDEEEEEEETDDEDVFSDDEKDGSEDNDVDDDDDDNNEADSDEVDDEVAKDDAGHEEKDLTVEVKKIDRSVSSSNKKEGENNLSKKTKKKSATVDVLKIPDKNTKGNKEVQIRKSNFSVPDNLETLLSIMKNKNDTSLYLSKVRSSNIADKKGLAKLVDLILQYVDYTCNQERPLLQNINLFSSVLSDLSQDVNTHLTKAIQSKLKIMFKRISSCVRDRKYSEASPTLDELVLLKMIDTVYPTSDLSHTVTTPALFIVCFIFVKVRPVGTRSIACGILLLDIVYSYVKLSKRYLPELILFLSRLMYEAVDITGASLNKFTSSALNMQRFENGHLHINEKVSANVEIRPFDISMFSKSSATAAHNFETVGVKLACVRNLLLTCQKFALLYSELETFAELIEPIAVLLRHFPLENYPALLKTLHCNVTETIASKCKSHEKVALKLQSRKPIPLTLLEPQYEDVNSADVFRKRGSGDKAKNEHDKLKYKVKRELKGAVKEIRKDTQFLAKQQLSEQLSKDATRKRKVKELKSALENEKREIKELERGSKKAR